jgi:hypothetical protein
VRAQDVLKNNMKGLIELAELLLEKEVIFSEDLERIFGKRKADILKEERESAMKNEASSVPEKETVITENGVVTKLKKSGKTSGKEKKASDKSAKKNIEEKTKSKN